MKTITANIIDIHKRQIFFGKVSFDKTIKQIELLDDKIHPSEIFIAPGFIDSHVHIESSMIIPQRFAEMVAKYGTIAVIADPHEIVNVLGQEGMDFMIENAKQARIKIFFATPSCVPATNFETNGATFGATEIEKFLPQCVALAEMMNYPGVIFEDKRVIEKLNIAKKLGKPTDGHAPYLNGEDLKKYVSHGISTDHECSTIKEAREKIALGMKILIREGSAAKNFEALSPLFHDNLNNIMLCTDDAHVDDIISNGHIDRFIRMGKKNGINIFDIYQAGLLNPKTHYKLDVGTLQVNDPADFIIINNLETFNVIDTYINGEAISKATNDQPAPINNFVQYQTFTPDDFKINITSNSANVIGVIDGELITKNIAYQIKQEIGEDFHCTDDVAKMAVINRYQVSPISLALIKGTGIKHGAIACSIAHDSHNVVMIGTDNESLSIVANRMFQLRGGLIVTDGSVTKELSLPYAGLMCNEDYQYVATKYEELITFARSQCGITLSSPFMTLAFMSLLVIPELKLSDKGLFDVQKFTFTNLFNG